MHHRFAARDHVQQNQEAYHLRNAGGQPCAADSKPQSEHQEYDPDLSPDLYVRLLHDRRQIIEIRADQKTRDDITQHDRLFQFAEDQRHDARDDQYQRQVGDQTLQVHPLCPFISGNTLKTADYSAVFLLIPL